MQDEKRRPKKVESTEAPSTKNRKERTGQHGSHSLRIGVVAKGPVRRVAEQPEVQSQERRRRRVSKTVIETYEDITGQKILLGVGSDEISGLIHSMEITYTHVSATPQSPDCCMRIRRLPTPRPEKIR